MNGIATYTEERTDPELVVRAQHGDRDAFGELFVRYFKGVYGIAFLRLRNAADADDIAADVFTQAMLKIDQLREPQAFGSWLKLITVRLSLNTNLRTKRHASFDEELASNLPSAGSDSTQVSIAMKAEQYELLRAAVGELKEIDREILWHFYFKGASILEISESLDIPDGTVKRRLFIARKRLRGRLEGESTYEPYR